jgi:hypothetical protein
MQFLAIAIAALTLGSQAIAAPVSLDTASTFSTLEPVEGTVVEVPSTVKGNVVEIPSTVIRPADSIIKKQASAITAITGSVSVLKMSVTADLSSIGEFSNPFHH